MKIRTSRIEGLQFVKHNSDDIVGGVENPSVEIDSSHVEIEINGSKVTLIERSTETLPGIIIVNIPKDLDLMEDSGPYNANRFLIIQRMEEE